jgi:hypothetical protein
VKKYVLINDFKKNIKPEEMLTIDFLIVNSICVNQVCVNQ